MVFTIYEYLFLRYHILVIKSRAAQTSFSANWNASTGATKYYLDVSTSAGFGAGTFVTGYQNLDVDNRDGRYTNRQIP